MEKDHKVYVFTALLFLARWQNCDGRLWVFYVCPSIRTEQLGSHGMYFYEIW